MRNSEVRDRLALARGAMDKEELAHGTETAQYRHFQNLVTTLEALADRVAPLPVAAL